MSSCQSCSGPNPSVTCPSRMHYAMMTDYRPRCIVNAELMQMLNDSKLVKSSYESRMYLQHNANAVMERERAKAIEKLAPCAPCNRPFNESGTMLPEKYVVRCNGVTCDREMVNPAGVGDGRMYNF